MSFVMILFVLSTPLAIASPVKVLNYKNSVKTIVNDLIDNWQSPIVYLKSRGYLPKNMENAPELDFENKFQKNAPETLSQLQQTAVAVDASPVQTNKKLKTKFYHEDKPNVQLKEAEYDSHKFKRGNRSFEDKESIDLKKMFHTLFSTNDNTISDEIKTKLDVPWDMNALKISARKEADKYYEKFCNKRNENDIDKKKTNTPEKIDAALQEQVAQLYPSVLGSKDMHWDIKHKELVASSAYKKPNFLKGIGKILGSRYLIDMSQESSSLHKRKQRQMPFF